MGSVDKACISGFLCRLCSEMHRVVIHVYGDRGLKLKLVDKINGYLPITILPNDHLPKTICEPCLHRVEEHYDLLLKLKHYGKNNFKINLKKIPNPNASNNNSDRTSIGVNTEEYDPRPQLRSLLLNSTIYSSDSSIHSSDEYDEFDAAEDDMEVNGAATNANPNNISDVNTTNDRILISDSADIDENAIEVNVIVALQSRPQDDTPTQEMRSEIEDEMRYIENDAAQMVPI